MLPTVDLQVIGLKNKATISALLDTGFMGYLCIPFQTARDLGLVLCGEEKYELANGQWITQFLFKGQVHFLGKTQEVEILVTDSETAQIGLLLLENCPLKIDFHTNKVQLTRKKT